MTTRNTVTILGAGAGGTTLAQLAAEAGHGVMLWSRDPEKAKAMNTDRATVWPGHRMHDNIRATADPAEAADFARLLLVAVPSHTFRAVTQTFGGSLRGDHLVVHAVKGLEPDTGMRMSEILKEETQVKRMGALSGPHIASDIMDGRPAAAVVASRYPEVVAAAQEALSTDRFRVYGGADPAGVEIAGAVNSIIAVFAGLSIGLEFGDGALAMIIARGAAETQRLGERLGAQPATFQGLAGIGDLIINCISPHSPNREAGERIARGEKPAEILESLRETAEGLKTVKPVKALAENKNVDMPIVAATHALIYENADPTLLQHLLMTRSRKYE